MGKVNNALKMLAILRSRKKVTRKELAEELEVTVREITRYKEDLEAAGVTITDIRGKYGGYILENKDYLLNLELSKNEEFSLELAREHLNHQGLHFYNDFMSAINKIKSINPINKEYMAPSIYSKGYKIKANHEEESKKWLTINDGIINGRKLKITYTNSNGINSERVVEPYGLFTYYGANYFVGKCEEKEDFRQFKLVRIQETSLLNDKFIKENFSLDNYLNNSIGVFKDDELNIILKITYPYAQGFKEVSWVESEEIEDLPEEGFIIYKAKVEGKTQIIPWLMGMGDSCEVIEPQSLKCDLIAAYKKVLEKYN